MPRGKQCGCICPSCRTPLIARQGNIKEWHFAHASRSVFSRTENECEYSFFVSIRMMARQIIGDSLEIVLPRYEGRVAKHLSRYDQWVSESFTVANQQKISITNVEVEKTFLGVPVDLYGRVKEIPFVIYFVHPGREVPSELLSPLDQKCGIVSISLIGLAGLYQGIRESGKSYQDLLYSYLANDVKSKKWVFHPRYIKCEASARKALEQKVRSLVTPRKRQKSRNKLEISTAAGKEDLTYLKQVESKPKKLAYYECVLCDTNWEGWEPGSSVCPKCNTHLYRTLKGYVENET